MNWMHIADEEIDMWTTISGKYKICTKIGNRRRNQMKEE